MAKGVESEGEESSEVINMNEESESQKNLLKLHELTCANVQRTDDISFKLLGFVPVLSGTGAAILSLAKIPSEIGSIPVLIISCAAMFITFFSGVKSRKTLVRGDI